jgi:ABC-type phosphate/phosphonate transport system substrate-binding protein
MVAIYQNQQLHAQLVVRKDSDIESFSELRNKDVAYPRKSKEHCRVFMERFCNECGECGPKSYFSNLCQPGSVESALDQLAEGKCHAVIGDKVDVDFFKRLKPGVFEQFKVVKSSEAFPSAVIAYCEGQVDTKILEQFRKGMIRANKSPRGRDMMGMWRITSFESIPENYQQNLEEILRCYPAPETKVSMR